MDHRYSSNWGFQGDILEELMLRFEKGADTILSLKSQIAEKKLRLQEACGDLERKLRDVRRAMKVQRATILSECISEKRQFDGEILRLQKRLMELKERLDREHARLHANDAQIVILEDIRGSLALQVSDEAAAYVSSYFSTIDFMRM